MTEENKFAQDHESSKGATQARSDTGIDKDDAKKKVKEKAYYKTMRKSMLASLVLVFLFGPLGLLYTSVLWGLIIIVLTIVLSALATPMAGMPLGWVLSLILAFVLPMVHNRKAKNLAKVITD